MKSTLRKSIWPPLQKIRISSAGTCIQNSRSFQVLALNSCTKKISSTSLLYTDPDKFYVKEIFKYSKDVNIHFPWDDFSEIGWPHTKSSSGWPLRNLTHNTEHADSLTIKSSLASHQIRDYWFYQEEPFLIQPSSTSLCLKLILTNQVGRPKTHQQ